MELWKEVRQRVLTGEISQRAALQQYHLGWRTLKNILTHDEPPGYRQSQPRKKRTLAPFLSVIQQILTDDRTAPPKQRHTAHRIFERLRDEHGYTGGETVVKDAVRDWKQRHQEVFLPLSHPPGEAQVDFGEATITLAGQPTKVVAQRCAADNADHLAFLLQLVELELIERERKAADRRLKAARFPTAKLLDEFDFAVRPSVNKLLMLELLKGEYLDRRENILLVGPSGTSKTHLATALGMAASAQGRKVRFFRVTELITLLMEAKEERSLLRLRQQLAKPDLLILDELGYVPASKTGAELLFDVIATAYERSSLLVTTNLPFENWIEVLGSERLTGAALDRLTHRRHILETKGESYRLQDAKRRRRIT